MPCLTFFGTVHSLESVTCATYAVGLLLIRLSYLLTEHISFAVLDAMLVTNIACKAKVYGDRVLNRVVVDVEAGDDEEAPATVDGLADLGEATLKRGKGEVGGGDQVVIESLGYVVSVVNMWSCSTPVEDLPLKAAKALLISVQSEALRTRVKCSGFCVVVVFHKRGPSSMETGDMVAVVWDIYAYEGVLWFW